MRISKLRDSKNIPLPQSVDLAKCLAHYQLTNWILVSNLLSKNVRSFLPRWSERGYEYENKINYRDYFTAWILTSL